MTKTLTEQWRNEELPINLYYVIDKLGKETIGIDCGYRDMMVDAFNGENIFIKEVLAPVPSYEECLALLGDQLERNEAVEINAELEAENKRLQERNEKLKKMAFHYTPEEWNTMMRMVERLQEQLAIATKALELYAGTDWWQEARQALKEMAGVK